MKIKFFTRNLSWMAYIVFGVSFGFFSLLTITNTYEKFSLPYGIIVVALLLVFIGTIICRIPKYIKYNRVNKEDRIK